LARIDAFLKLGMQQGCSDVHLAVGVPPMLRMNGDLMPIKFRDVGDAELESYLTEIFTKNQHEYFAKGNDLVTCVNKALAQLRADGTLNQLADKWISSVGSAPVLK